MQRGVAPIANTFLITAVGSEHRRESARAAQSQIDPTLCLRMLVVKHASRETEPRNGNDFKIGGIENDRPAAEIDAERIFALRIKTPTAHAIGMQHAVERAITRRRAFFGNLFFDFRNRAGAQRLAQPFAGKTHRDSRLRRAL